MRIMVNNFIIYSILFYNLILSYLFLSIIYFYYIDSKLDDYQEHLRKMKIMAFESKKIEENMKEFANMVGNIAGKNKSS